MNPRNEIGLLGALLDLPIVDSEGRQCGVVDDIELEEVRGGLKVRALLVGPGAYRQRLPGWMYRLVATLAGDRIVRVPWDAIGTIGSRVQLNRTANQQGLHRAENRFRRAIPHRGAL